jgi:hypothetical protein
MEPNWQRKPALNPAFSWEPMPDGCLVYRTDSGQVLTLNPAAELILTYCDGSMTLAEIFRDITTDLAMPETDFLAAIEKLVAEQALTMAPA